MKAWVREFRLIPIALVGLGALLVLKVAGLLLEGGYTLGDRMNRGETITVTTMPASNSVQLRSETVPLNVASTQRKTPWLQELFFPQTTTSQNPSTPADTSIITGSVPSKPPEPKKPEEPPATKPAAAAPPAPPAQEPPKQFSTAERAVLERLGERRQQLDARTRELDIRENLLKAAEDKLKVQATAAPAAPGQEPTATSEQPAVGRFKNLVTMYETMKPKDAAKIFDRLDLKVLIEMSTLINPRKMSEIMAQMSPELAEKLTVELAARARDPDRLTQPTELPKIEGKPIAN